MTGVWIGGFLAELTRSAMVRWAVEDVRARIGCELGEDAIKSRSIGKSCTAVLSIVDESFLLARCSRDSPPRWTDLSGVTHVLRPRRDPSDTQLSVGRAVGVLYGQIGGMQRLWRLMSR